MVTQLKKTYTLLNENYRLTLAKEGCTDAISCGFMEVTGVSMGPYGTWAGGANFDLDISYSPSFYSKLASNIKLGDAFVMPPNAEDMSPEEQQSFIEANMNTILKYANHSIKSMDKTKDYFPFASVAYLGTTPDGAYIGIFLPDFYIDVNGVKGLNILGRDVFVFYITDSQIIPYYTDAYRTFTVKMASMYSNGNPLIPSSFPKDRLKDNCLNSDNINYSSAKNCTALIFYDGWEMKY